MKDNMIVSRILPDHDFKNDISLLQQKNSLKAGIIICAVGSLKEARLRMPSGRIKYFKGPLEIVSAQGTVSPDGVHVHLAVSDEKGQIFGGHLKKGCIVHTTIELCVLIYYGEFKRIMDPKTGFKELIIK